MRKQSTNSNNLRVIIVPFVFTIVTLLIVWGGYKVIKNWSNKKPSFLQSTQTSPVPTKKPSTFTAGLNIPAAEVDSDSDGLSDALELLYKTDKKNPDTDGDGYKDGEEVANNYDPTIPSPNDKIARATNDLTASPLPTPTLTQQFVNKTGATEISTETEDEINNFINETNARGILPVILDSDIHISSTSGKTAIVKYLDTLSAKKNKKLKSVTPEEISTAFETYVKTKSSTALDTIISKLENNTNIFAEVQVPQEAVELHKKYYAAVLALRDNTKTLKNYQTDYMSTLVAASRIEGLRAIFTEVETDIKNLEKKYNIT